MAGSRPSSIPSALQHIVRSRRVAVILNPFGRARGRGEKRAKERAYDVNWKRFLSCHGARFPLSLSLVAKAKSHGAFLLAHPSAPPPFAPSLLPLHHPSRRRATAHRSLEAAKVRGDGIRAIRERRNWPQVKRTGYLQHPSGLILRGNDDLGTILSSHFPFSLSRSRFRDDG